jgi:large subunit ribosomal protein L13
MTHLALQTIPTKKQEIIRNWHIVDAKDMVLGRVSSQICTLLQGKHKANYAPYVDCGDNVVVINAKQVRVTGSKLTSKIYDTYSGYPGGRKEITLKDLLAKSTDKVFRSALMGMLPKNKLRDVRIARLHIFDTDVHTFTDKFNT